VQHPRAMFTPGARVGDYRIDHELAEDESGIVYLATHVVLPRQSQLKVAHAGSRTAAMQLLREACILEALSNPCARGGHTSQPGHPGIPRVHECGVLGDRRPWSAQERISGTTFERFVGAGSLALSDLAVAVREIADVLRHAHERGVVHGGLTEVAIMRTQRRYGVYAIVDWSHARTLDTESGAVVDPRDDMRALGEIAFRALTGKPAEPGLLAKDACPGAPVELLAVIDGMLAEPVMRPSAADVFERIAWLCDTLEVSPLLERARWTPPESFVPQGISSGRPGSESGSFAVRIGRPRSS
jgi:serine/threonine protein kinase